MELENRKASQHGECWGRGCPGASRRDPHLLAMPARPSLLDDPGATRARMRRPQHACARRCSGDAICEIWCFADSHRARDGVARGGTRMRLCFRRAAAPSAPSSRQPRPAAPSPDSSLAVGRGSSGDTQLSPPFLPVSCLHRWRGNYWNAGVGLDHLQSIFRLHAGLVSRSDNMPVMCKPLVRHLRRH